MAGCGWAGDIAGRRDSSVVTREQGGTMGRKRKSELIIDEQGQGWDPDDFDLDSHGVEAPLRERL